MMESEDSVDQFEHDQTSEELYNPRRRKRKLPARFTNSLDCEENIEGLMKNSKYQRSR